MMPRCSDGFCAAGPRGLADDAPSSPRHRVVAVADALDSMQTLANVLAEHGPLDDDEIVLHLRERGVADPIGLLEQVLYETDCPASQLVDDRWVWLPSLLAGRVFTHRVGADELTHDLLTVTPDLDPITTLCEYEQYRRLADGTAVREVLAGFDDELLEQRGVPDGVVDPLGALLLEPGTLRALGVTEGDLVGVRLTTQGLVVERVIATAPSAVGARLAAIVDAEEPEYFDAAVWTACAQDPALFAKPLAPLSEIADDHGLARHGEWLAPAGFDFDRWEFEGGCARLAARYELDSDDAFALYTLVELCERMSLLLTAFDADEPLEDLVGVVDDNGAPEPELDGLADLMGAVGAAIADPLLADLLVTETIGAGRVEAAALGLFAEVLEPKVPRTARVACRWLRAVALDRIGDIEGSERELLAAESMDTDWPLPLFDLARIASDRGDVERGLALLRRAGAGPDHPLVAQLQQFRAEPRGDLGRNDLCWCGSGRKYKRCHLGREALPLAERVDWLYSKAAQHAVLGGWNDVLSEVGLERCRYDDDPDALEAALADPLVLDAVLFEGGAFAEFLQLRGSLLPDDERLLAQQWLLVQRSVFEVERVDRGRGIVVRDVRTGDTHEVRERAASRQLQPGQLICARVVPAGDTMQIFGGLEPVALHERDPLIDLLDTEPDPVTLVAWLSRRFAPPTLVNTEGDPLAVCEAADLAGQMPLTGEGAVDPDDPQVAAFLEEFVRDYETKWLDEPIPALDGHSPRQAADDPTRRADLIRLLDTFPAVEPGGIGMDPVRLRAALGLP